MITKKTIRSEAGLTLVLLIWLVGFLIVLGLGLVSFEVARGYNAYDNLRSATESAALSGAAALASSNNTSPVAAHSYATTSAIKTFQSNSILGNSLSGALVTSSAGSIPASNSSGIFIEYLDPNNGDAPSATGRVVHTVGTYGLLPAFNGLFKALGFNTYSLRTQAFARVPQLDVEMCFDVSSSIDDQTVCTFVKRSWDPINQKITYTIPSCAARGSEANPIPMPTMAGLPHGALAAGAPPYAEGPLLQILDAAAVGIGVDAQPPQGLDQANAGNADAPLVPNFPLRNYNQTTLIANIPDAGVPPGNYTNIACSTGSDFTDVVTNIDYAAAGSANTNTTYQFDGGGSYTFNFGGINYPFPDLATLVEAQRGNLENQTVFNASKASTTINNPAVLAIVSSAGANGSSGYYAAYQAAVHPLLQPIGAMQQAALTFFNIMNINTDAHFGLLSFGSHVALNPTDGQGTDNKIGWGDSSGGTVNPTSPGIYISNNNATAASNLAAILNPTTGVQLTIPNGGTNISDAVEVGYNSLLAPTQAASLDPQSNLTADAGAYTGANQQLQGRPQSKKVIILFTDGQNNPVNTNWQSTCNLCAQNGVAVYCVGFAQSSKIIPGECNLLNDSPNGQLNPIPYTDPYSGLATSYTPTQQGIAGMAGNGGKFFLVTNVKNLNYVFENIARQLVQLTKN